MLSPQRSWHHRCCRAPCLPVACREEMGLRYPLNPWRPLDSQTSLSTPISSGDVPGCHEKTSQDSTAVVLEQDDSPLGTSGCIWRGVAGGRDSRMLLLLAWPVMQINILHRTEQAPPRRAIHRSASAEHSLGSPALDGEPGALRLTICRWVLGLFHLHPVLKSARSLSAQLLPYHARAQGHMCVPDSVALSGSGPGFVLEQDAYLGRGWAASGVLTVMMVAQPSGCPSHRVISATGR